ncbi:hypothetical protein FKM82_024053 [Ascaphus truei]
MAPAEETQPVSQKFHRGGRTMVESDGTTLLYEYYSAYLKGCSSTLVNPLGAPGHSHSCHERGTSEVVRSLITLSPSTSPC